MPLPASILTPLSSDTAYATPNDLLARFDLRDIQQWASDSRLPVSQQQTQTNAKIAAALADASGEVEAACLMSDKYLPQDLQSLTGNSLALLKRIVCEKAVGFLFENRLRRGDEPLPGVVEHAEKVLERLRKGEWVFGFVEHGDAGVIGHEVETPCEVAARNMTTQQAERFFSRRSNRYLPYGPGGNAEPPQVGGTGLVGGP